MPVLKLARAAAAVPLLAIAGTAAVTTGAGAAARQTTSTGIVTTVAQKLAANSKFPYTQFAISFPQISGGGISAKDAAIATGLKLVVDSVTTKPGQTATAELDVYYKAVDLAELRIVGGNYYVLLDIAKWGALPLNLSASTSQSLTGLDAAFGGRWLELPASAIAQLTKKSARTATASPVLNQLQTSPAAIEKLVLSEIPQLLNNIAVSEAPAAGGNETFKASGSLQTLAANAKAVEIAVQKQLKAKTSTLAPMKALKGTFALQMTTAAAGAYIGSITLAVDEPGKAAVTIAITLSHQVLPIVAPKGAKVLPPSMLAGL